MLAEQRADERRAEDHPDADRQEDPGDLAEQLGRLLALACRGAEGQSRDECRDEPVAAEAPRMRSSPEGQGEARRSAGTARRSASAGRRPRAGGRRCRRPRLPTTMAMAISVERRRRDGALRAAGGGRERDEEEHERRRDAVVETALDVEDAPDPDRDGGVGDDGKSQGGVGRGEDRADEQRGRQRELGEDEPGDEPAGGDRQQQPDPEQATDEAGVAPEAVQVDGRGIGEQDEGEGDLGQRVGSSSTRGRC